MVSLLFCSYEVIGVLEDGKDIAQTHCSFENSCRLWTCSYSFSQKIHPGPIKVFSWRLQKLALINTPTMRMYTRVNSVCGMSDIFTLNVKSLKSLCFFNASVNFVIFVSYVHGNIFCYFVQPCIILFIVCFLHIWLASETFWRKNLNRNIRGCITFLSEIVLTYINMCKILILQYSKKIKRLYTFTYNEDFFGEKNGSKFKTTFF